MTDAEQTPPVPVPSGDLAEMAAVRLDKWLWAARCFKTRSQAGEAVAAGHVKVNGDSVKTAKMLRRGDQVTIRGEEHLRILDVVGLSDKRGPAPVARTLYVDRSPPRDPAKVGGVTRDRGLGRPTKRELRDIRRVRGY
jgi:ribosome-associated heat shock protein Hsp15